ncbi:MAG: hypothetical protein CMK92_04975 [Pseudomonas sp.]|nr:hypothetical protein [Pseudomonas sp.]
MYSFYASTMYQISDFVIKNSHNNTLLKIVVNYYKIIILMILNYSKVPKSDYSCRNTMKSIEDRFKSAERSEHRPILASLGLNYDVDEKIALDFENTALHRVLRIGKLRNASNHEITDVNEIATMASIPLLKTYNYAFPKIIKQFNSHHIEHHLDTLNSNICLDIQADRGYSEEVAAYVLSFLKMCDIDAVFEAISGSDAAVSRIVNIPSRHITTEHTCDGPLIGILTWCSINEVDPGDIVEVADATIQTRGFRRDSQKAVLAAIPEFWWSNQTFVTKFICNAFHNVGITSELSLGLSLIKTDLSNGVETPQFYPLNDLWEDFRFIVKKATYNTIEKALTSWFSGESLQARIAEFWKCVGTSTLDDNYLSDLMKCRIRHLAHCYDLCQENKMNPTVLIDLLSEIKLAGHTFGFETKLEDLERAIATLHE